MMMELTQQYKSVNYLDNEKLKLSKLIDSLPKTYQSPTMGPFCKDDEKYEVIEEITKKL